MRRLGYGPTLVVGLAGAVALTVGVAKPWFTATAEPAGLPTVQASVTGAALAPLAGALSVVALAAFGAVIATRGRIRQAMGVLITVVAAVVLAAVIQPPSPTQALQDALSARGWNGGGYDAGSSPWRWITLSGAMLCVAAGLAVTRYGGRWSTMGRRYDAPTAPAEAAGKPGQVGAEPLTEADVWREIDRGRDPTQGG